MNFDFSDDQKELKEQVRRFLKDKCPLTVPRRILESDEPYAKEVWTGLGEMGFTGAVIPEEYGGSGLGYLELCVIAEELGRAVAPIPFTSTVYLAAEAILLAGNDAQKEEYLRRMASGGTIGAIAVAEGTHRPLPENLAATVANGKLNGVKVPVADGDVADFAIVAAKDGSGVSLVLVDLTASGVTRDVIETVDPTRSHARLTFKNAAAELLGTKGRGWELLDRVFDRAAVLIAFEQIGGADACLHMSRNYSLERYAFGRAIGSFQAIKHRMAEIYVKNELARSNAYYGAWALSKNAPELAVAAAGARVAATEAYNYASKENIQIHGGMGYTWEYDAHFFYRRAKLLSLCLGGPVLWKDRLISALEHAPKESTSGSKEKREPAIAR